jgi:RHS repeat-associated protein
MRARILQVWVLTFTTLAFGQVNKAGPEMGWLDGHNNGAYTHHIPIDVPPFHGLEPRLGVDYNSSASAGLMGVGWSLSGFSMIERTSLGRGAPSYDAAVLQTTDMFLLDGAEMLLCPTGSLAPSCTSGGNFMSQVETYQRIVYSSSNDTWAITGKDGTVRTYAPIYSVTDIHGAWWTWRYGIQTETDALGNTVTYNWVNNQWSCCWVAPASVTYNGVTINFAYQQLSSSFPSYNYANGTSMESIRGVLQSIDVQVSGQRARAYQFNYNLASDTHFMLLASVQEFGKDAVLSGGAVVSGASLPAQTMAYSGTDPSFSSGPGGSNSWGNANDQFFNIDYNGDGIQDLIVLVAPATTGKWTRYIYLGKGDGSFLHIANDTAMDYSLSSHYYVADVNADGMGDFVEMYNNGTSFTRTTYLSTGTGGYSKSSSDTNVGYYSTSQFIMMDVNGDGKTDMVELWPRLSNLWYRHIWFSTGTGFTGGANDSLTRYTSTPSYYLSIDANGDGRADMLEIHQDPNKAGQWDRQLWMSTGAHFQAAQLDTNMAYNSNSQFLTGDFNGDGKTDLVELLPSGTHWNRQMHQSYGTGFLAPAWDTALGYPPASTYQYVLLDTHGSGHEDMLELRFNGVGSFDRHIWKYAPSVQFMPVAEDSAMDYHASTSFLFGDFDGDGLPDMMQLVLSNNYWSWHTWLNTGNVPNLLTSITNEAGGTTTITYKASSVWSNSNNPSVVQTLASVTESDGRGWSATTSYSYSGGTFDWSMMRFQGFKTVTETRPRLSGESAGPTTVYTYDMPANCGAQSPLSTVADYDSNGNTLTATVNTVAENCSAPFTALVSESKHLTYDPNNSSNSWMSTEEYPFYDAYGNVTQVTSEEADLIPGTGAVYKNKTTEAITYNYNTSAYVVDDPAIITTYAGSGTGGTLLAQSLNYYDCDPVTLQNCNNSAAPTKGLLNRVDRYLNMQSYSNPTSSYLTTKSRYDSHGNATDLYDANNNHSSFAYDSTYSVFVTSATNALGQSATMGFDYVCGEVTSVTDLNSQTTNTTLDALCRTTQVSLPNGGYVKTQYLNFGSPTTQYVETDVPGPSGDIYSRSYFDGLDRGYKTIARGVSADREVDTTFDARSNVSTVTAPYFVGGSGVVSTFSYDALNRATKVTLPDNNIAQTFYGPTSNCNNCSVWSVTEVDPLGHKQTDWHDGHGNLIQQDEYVGGSWNSATYAYDLLDSLSSSTDPSGNVITYTVDSLGRALGVNDPDQGLWTYTYDANSNVLTETDALVTPVVSYAYDALNRLTSKTTSGDGNAFTWTYDQAQSGYYNVGRLSAKADPYGSQTFNYDNVGNLVASTRTTDGVNYSFNYTYDVASRPLTVTYPDGDSVGTMAYDVAGRLASVPNLVTSVSYDALSRPTSLVNANGTTQSWTYDPNRFWVTSVTTTSGTTNLQALTYGFDADGNRTSVTSNSSNNSDESWTYAYDELHRVTSATDSSNAAYSQAFSYNAAGNIVSNSRVGSYTYPTQGAGSVRPHAVSAAGSNTYAYNANGQMTSRAGTALSWNGDHMLASDGANSYSYGGNKELLKLVNGSGNTYYVGDDFEVAPDGTQNKYIGGMAVRMFKTGIGNTTRWMHSDFNGSVQVQSDGSTPSGVETLRKKYYVTGDSLSTTGSDSQSKGFTGQRQEPGSGLTYLHARFFDSLLGRFISPDSITPENHGNAGLNRYAYAMNDFVNKEDVSGNRTDANCGFGCATGGGHVQGYPASAPVTNWASWATNTHGSGNEISQQADTTRSWAYSTWQQGPTRSNYYNYYYAKDFYGRRGRLGRKGRLGRTHCQVVRCVARHRASARHQPPGWHAHHMAHEAHKQHDCSGLNYFRCHKRGTEQAATIVGGSLILAGVCVGTGGAGCLIASGIVGGANAVASDLTCGCNVSIPRFAEDAGLGVVLGVAAPGVPGPSYAARAAARIGIGYVRQQVTNQYGNTPGTNEGWGTTGWGGLGILQGVASRY